MVGLVNGFSTGITHPRLLIDEHMMMARCQTVIHFTPNIIPVIDWLIIGYHPLFGGYHVTSVDLVLILEVLYGPTNDNWRHGLHSCRRRL